jgi:nucleoside-diphosphate-sugar epimerase
VLGDVSAEPLRPDAEPAPADVYARSKHEAEQQLLSHADNAMRVVIVRPPLVYGPGVKGNMAALLRLVDSGLPLPLDRAVGLRSLVAVDNLVDLLVRLGGSAVAADVLHVRDAEDLTVRDLVLALGRALERRVRLVAVPEPVVGCAAKAIGRSAWYERLFLPCRVDDSATRESLGWQPPVATEQAITDMGAWWRTR